MPSSWDSDGPKRKLVTTHFHICCWYGLVSAVLALFLVLTLAQGISYPHLTLLAGSVGLLIAHHKIGAAIEEDRKWAPAATILLSLLLLPAVPVGTFFGIKLFVNASKLMLEQ